MADIVDSFVNRHALVRHDAPALPLEHRWHVVDGNTMHVRTSQRSLPGQPNVVFVHGLGVSSLYFVPSAQRFATYAKVYAPDLPGFGLSEKPDEVLDVGELTDRLAHFLELVGATPAVLVGNSFGCQIAARCAVEYPSLVSGLILVGPTIDPKERSVPTQLLRWCTTVPREPFSLYFAVGRDYLIAGPKRLWKTFQYALDDPIEQMLPRVEAPAIVVRGERDPIVSQRWAEQVADLLPDGRLEVVSGSAHTVHYGAADKLSRISRPFVLSRSTRPG